MASTAVFGLYSVGVQAAETIDELRIEGFRRECVSVLFAGAVAGVALRGASGWLVRFVEFNVPDAGPFIAAGPIAAVVSAAGAVVGGIAACLIRLGLPEREIKRYERRIRSGCLLLSVHCEDPHLTQDARRILEQTGARNIALGEPGGVQAGGAGSGRRAA